MTQLVVGDRVRVQARTARFVPAGTLGQIAQMVIVDPDLYFVQFDGYSHALLMHASDLELVTEADESTT